ncbi:cytochrome ubiquinol oxidase subunit I [Bifidobacterium mellis]|uniref:Cytochrome bd ubiquinol oxidase subunit I cydA n=1 Tax=Bifidobacterium mellis TaxID=1293823 RepID=A0A0F4KZX2_9BIFI|nr:cytochrome ubiquinol oxidase subunit I [Bifidobacterium mellis]KJY52177.1 cytochrome bd ubiquinol oxidase subunit I cydA [Bifidobacterium mellis]
MFTVLGLSRFQFAMTTIFHFFYVPMTIGLALAVAIMETTYVVTKKDVYKKMTMFWSKIFLLSFAVGVVTGIIQEFQFGMNWSNYSRFMGDIFGAPLAIEALLAFFLESTFIGVWMFTWNRFKPAVHAVFIWLTFLGSSMSAIWILAANSFMQHPVGFEINQTTGHVRLRNFGDVMFNPQLWIEFPHVFFAAVCTGAFVVMGCSAFSLLRMHMGNKDQAVAAVEADSEKQAKVNLFTKSIRLAALLGLIGSICVITYGDLQGKYIVTDQPMKLAATEGIYEDTGDPAPWNAVALINEKDHKIEGSVEIPGAMSQLAYGKKTGAVKGMNTVNKELHEKYDAKYGKDMNYYVPVTTLFWVFRLMVAIGFAFALISALVLWFTRKKKNTLFTTRWKLWIMGIFTFAPFAATTSGWLVTELGRYPWLVYGYQTIADGVSPTSTVPNLLFTCIVYFLLFLVLGGVMVFYTRRTLHQGPFYKPDDGNGPQPAKVHGAPARVALA